MPKKLTVTFDEDTDEVRLNGERTTPHTDGNNGRNVYFAGQFVIKVDDRGYYHDDLSVWKSIKRKDRKYFVPTLAQGETNGVRWSIQPYVHLIEDYTEEDKLLVSELCDKYGLRDIDHIHDTSARNWAINADTGEPVIFDYGFGGSDLSDSSSSYYYTS